MEGVMNMNKFKHYGKDVWVQTFTEINWVDGLKKNGLEYVALPDLEHEVYKYVKNGKERYALIHYPDVPEEALQEVYIIEKIPDDLSWDNIIEDDQTAEEEVETNTIRRSVADLHGVKKDNYEGLPEELKEFNYYFADCGHSILAIPECKLDEAIKDGDLDMFECPFPVKYVLEKGYRMYKNHVVCEAEYHPAFGLVIDEEWDEF